MAVLAGSLQIRAIDGTILYENCVTCHRPGQAAPFSLISYDDAKKKGKLIQQVYGLAAPPRS
jgi:hypothetical protein